MASITIHTDGSCHSNPGPGGYAAIIEIPRHDPMRVTGSEVSTTNNRMELRAVIEGLRALQELANVNEADVEVRSDSKYVCDAFNKGWIANWQQNGWRTASRQTIKNQDLWLELTGLAAVPSTTFTHVRGHSGDPWNEECDRLANIEADEAGQRRRVRPSFIIDGMDGQMENRPDSPSTREDDHQGPNPLSPYDPDDGPDDGPDDDPEGAPGAYNRGWQAGYETARREIMEVLQSMDPRKP